MLLLNAWSLICKERFIWTWIFPSRSSLVSRIQAPPSASSQRKSFWERGLGARVGWERVWRQRNWGLECFQGSSYEDIELHWWEWRGRALEGRTSNTYYMDVWYSWYVCIHTYVWYTYTWYTHIYMYTTHVCYDIHVYTCSIRVYPCVF